MEGNSSVSASFGFGKTDSKKEDVEVKDSAENTIKFGAKPVEEDDIDKPYYDQRTVTIALVKNYSLFRRANEKVMPKKTDYIGSSITSSRVLCSNKGEIEAYMPNIIGLAPNNDNFVTRVKQYFNNIQIPVNELNKTFYVGFHYNTKRD